MDEPLSAMFGVGLELAQTLAEVIAERDALVAVLRDVLVDSWECSDPETCACSHARAHRLIESRVAATDQGTNSSAGSGCDTEPGAGPHAALVAGEGPHDATSSPCGGAAEGTLPAPGNPPHAPRVLP